MYSPVRQNMTKEAQRVQLKEQKKMQLMILLVNKFRNKLNVNNITEPDLDKIIKDEVEALVNKGSMHESDLHKLDKKFQTLIKQQRMK